MKVTDFSIEEGLPNSYHQPFREGVQKARKENSIFAYLQNEELSSIGEDAQQKDETSLRPVHCNGIDDMLAAIKSGAKCVEIPDETWQKAFADSAKGGHLDNPGKDGHILSEMDLEFYSKCGIFDKDDTLMTAHR